MRAVYTGVEALTFNDYIDLGTGMTLAAVPGGVYDVAPASGRPVPDLPEGWFTPVSSDDGDEDDDGTDEAEVEAEADPEPGDEG